jgi:hypothetical protein
LRVHRAVPRGVSAGDLLFPLSEYSECPRDPVFREVGTDLCLLRVGRRDLVVLD